MAKKKRLRSDNWKKITSKADLLQWEHITSAKLILVSFLERYTNPKRAIYFWQINLNINGKSYHILESRLQDYGDFDRDEIVLWNKNTKKSLLTRTLRFRKKSNNWKIAQFRQYGKKKDKQFQIIEHFG